MKHSPLVKSIIIRTVFVAIELIAFAILSIITLTNDGESPWGYWGIVFAVFGMISPVIIYIIASTIFNIFNLIIILKKRHTVETLKKYYEISFAYLIWGILTGGLYGLGVIFLFENLFLFEGYRKELQLIKKP